FLCAPTTPEPSPLSYTTLFRSRLADRGHRHGAGDRGRAAEEFASGSHRRVSRRQCAGAGAAGIASAAISGIASPGLPISASSRRSEEHTSELQSRENLVCRLLL